MTNQLVFGVRKTSSNATIPIFRFFVMQGTGKLATDSAFKKGGNDGRMINAADSCPRWAYVPKKLLVFVHGTCG